MKNKLILIILFCSQNYLQINAAQRQETIKQILINLEKHIKCRNIKSELVGYNYVFKLKEDYINITQNIVNYLKIKL